MEHIRCELHRGRQPGDGPLGVVADLTDAAVHPDQRTEPDRRDDEPDKSVGNQPSAQPVPLVALAEGPRLIQSHASYPHQSSAAVGSIWTAGASLEVHLTNLAPAPWTRLLGDA